MESTKATTHGWFIHYIASLSPKLHDSEKSMSRESAAEKDIIKRE
jgi:hypothetical protein